MLAVSFSIIKITVVEVCKMITDPRKITEKCKTSHSKNGRLTIMKRR